MHTKRSQSQSLAIFDRKFALQGSLLKKTIFLEFHRNRQRFSMATKSLSIWPCLGSLFKKKSLAIIPIVIENHNRDCNAISKFHFARLTRSHPPNTRVFLLRLSHPCTRPFLARPRPFLARSSPVPRLAPRPTPPTIVSSNLAVKPGKREIY